MLDAPARPRRLAAEPEAGQRRAHHVERVCRVAAVAGRIGQRPDHLPELDDRPGPAVRQHERQRVRTRRADMQEMDVQAVDLGPELRERVEARLARTPVVARQPVVAQGLHVAERAALRPVVDGRRLSPPRLAEPPAKVVQVGFGDFDPERGDLVAHALSMARRRVRRSGFPDGSRRQAASGSGLVVSSWMRSVLALV